MFQLKIGKENVADNTASNVKLIFLSSNPICVCQPLNQGLIQNFKYYCNLILQHIVTNISSGSCIFENVAQCYLRAVEFSSFQFSFFDSAWVTIHLFHFFFFGLTSTQHVNFEWMFFIVLGQIDFLSTTSFSFFPVILTQNVNWLVNFSPRQVSK